MAFNVKYSIVRMKKQIEKLSIHIRPEKFLKADTSKLKFLS